MNYYNEFEPKAVAALKQLIIDRLIPAGEVDTRSITDVRPEDLEGFTQCHFFAGIGGWSRALQLAGWPDDRPVWTGSCPCQPFSAAGKQKGGTDDRDLWPVWFNLIRECRPASVYGEQVASAIPHGWLDRVYSDMEGAGYACGAAVLPACAINAPHRRDRLGFVAIAGHGRRGNVGPAEIGENAPGERPADTGEAVRPGADVAHAADQGRQYDPKVTGGDEKRMGPSEPWSQSGAICGLDTLADTSDLGPREKRLQRVGEQRFHAESGCSPRYEGDGEREAGSHDHPPQSLDDTQPARPQGYAGHDSGTERRQEPTRSTAPAGFWDDADWILCADGKARRIPATQSGIRLLAHGIPERVGLLRAAGNAIVPEVFARFIRATEGWVRGA